MKKNNSVFAYLLLHIALLIYSTSGLFSKNASRHPFGSLPFILFYAGMIAVLGIYAILWQQVIKRMNVTTAYANKAVTVVWGVVLGILFFGEKISLRQVIACGVIILGTVMYVRADRAQEEEDSRTVQGNAKSSGGGIAQSSTGSIPQSNAGSIAQSSSENSLEGNARSNAERNGKAEGGDRI